MTKIPVSSITDGIENLCIEKDKNGDKIKRTGSVTKNGDKKTNEMNEDIKTSYKKLMPEIGKVNKDFAGYDPDDMSKMAFIEQENNEIDNVMEITAILRNTHLDDSKHLTYFT